MFKTVGQVKLSEDSFLWLMEKENVIQMTPWQNDVGHGTAVLDKKQAIALAMLLIQWTDGVKENA